VVVQIDSLLFLSDKLPPGMIGALFLQGAITTAVFAALAVLLLGKWRAGGLAASFAISPRLRPPSAAWRFTLIVVAFVFLYMFFGYYVAWQNPALRQYYGGPEYSSFYDAVKANRTYPPWIYPI